MEKVNIQRPNLEDISPNREKKYEDALLRKLQSEYAPMASSTVEELPILRDENRTQYEQALLERLMATIQHHTPEPARHLKQPKSETLMITSAVPLTDDEKERLVRKFIEKTNRPLRKITSVVDPNLITGLRLQSETFYYEVSGQKKLREMRAFLEKSWLQEEDKA